MREMILIIISAVLINNIILSQFLGVCPFWVFRKNFPQQWEWE